MRRYRTRRREGSRIARTTVDADVVAALVDTGMLSPEEANDPQCLGDFLADITDCWIRGNLEIPLRRSTQVSDTSTDAPVCPPRQARP